MSRKVVVIVGALLAAVVSTVLVPAAGSAERPQRFIVVFKDFATPQAGPAAREISGRFGSRPDAVYEHALKGFSVSLPPGLAAKLAEDDRVAYVERDGEVTTMATQNPATWGLDRIDQRGVSLSGTFAYEKTGVGVKAYIIDTGIRTSHTDFGGRAIDGRDTVDGSLPAADCNGHGTHVAGTVGGATWGVAKGVALVAVRVLNCAGSGTWSGVIAGIDWVTADHVRMPQPAVANMSLGGGASTAVDTAVRNSIAAGVSYAVAAGNGSSDACLYSPAHVTEAMTIGATDNLDRKPSWSNYGTCVDFFAPGVGIKSAWRTSNTATNTISGTSMATPHTTGVAALYLQSNPAASPVNVRDALYGATTKGIVTPLNTVNNHLLFTSY